MEFHMTKHAIDRALDMAVDASEIRAAMEKPERVYPAPDDYPLGSQMRQHGRIVLAYDVETRHVLTIIWNGGSAEDRDRLDVSRDNYVRSCRAPRNDKSNSRQER